MIIRLATTVLLPSLFTPQFSPFLISSSLFFAFLALQSMLDGDEYRTDHAWPALGERCRARTGPRSGDECG
ncbi:hypothetical protein N9A58_09595 [Opitutales bacterium]|nr:hypothetical protein [Opitutales bacterium]